MSGPDSDVHPFTWLDYVIFSAMLAVSAITGLYHAFVGDGQKSTAKFLMAERSMMSIPVAISVIASYLSAITILGVPSEVFVYGIQYWMVIWSFFIAIPVTAIVFIPVFHGLGLTSAYDYLHKRFSPLVRSIGAAFFILQTLLYIAVVLYAPALALEAATKFPIFATVLGTGALCTIYTALGGIKAVIWTDVFQFVVLFGSLLTITIMGIVQAGGMEYIWDYNYERGHLNFFDFSPDPTHRLSFWGMIIGGNFNTLTIWAVSQTSVQRFLTAKNLKEAKRSVWFGLPGTVIVLTLVSLIGLVMFAYYNNLETPLTAALNATLPTPVNNSGPEPHYTPNYKSADQILVYFVSLEFGKIPGIQGLFVACLFAGTLSTVSSGLNALAAVTLMDVVRIWRGKTKPQEDPDADDEATTNESTNSATTPPTSTTSTAVTQAQDRRDTFISKILTAGYGAVSIGLAFLASKLGSLVKMANTVLGGVGGPLLGVFSLGMLYRRANTGGALIGLLVGSYLSLWITIGAATHQDENGNIKEDAFALYRVSFMWYSMFSSLATFIVGIIVSEIIRCYIPDERYKRVDPLLLATFLRPKGWRKTYSGESCNPDVQIGDPVFQSLLASGNQSMDQENESLLGDIEGNDVHELGSVQSEVTDMRNVQY